MGEWAIMEQKPGKFIFSLLRLKRELGKGGEKNQGL